MTQITDSSDDAQPFKVGDIVRKKPKPSRHTMTVAGIEGDRIRCVYPCPEDARATEWLSPDELENVTEA